MSSTTNASSALTAQVLKDARVGTFTSLVTTKKGTEKGKGTDKKRYGNDRVQVVIFTGFNYPRLVVRSLNALNGVTDAQILAEDLTREQDKCRNSGGDASAIAAVTARFTEADVVAARAELVESFTKTSEGTNESTTDAVYEPLVVDGETVKGCRVYRCKRLTGAEGECHCRACTGDEKAPREGTVYLQGLQIWSKVLTPAENGPVPPANSAAKTIAKDALRGHCPIRRYVSYPLEPRPTDAEEAKKWVGWELHAGGTAVLEATEKGFCVTDDILSVIEKSA